VVAVVVGAEKSSGYHGWGTKEKIPGETREVAMWRKRKAEERVERMKVEPSRDRNDRMRRMSGGERREESMS
jgi:hypothetical protein